MIINFIAQRNKEYILTVDKDSIWIDGVEFDFSPLPEGAELPASAINSDWFFDKVKRVNGEIEITLFRPHGANAPNESLVNETVVVKLGNVQLPIYEIPPEEPDYGEVTVDPEPVVDEPPFEEEA